MKIMSNSISSSLGIKFSGLLTVVFILLKLTEIIDWKWIWVLSPLWIGIVLWIIIVLGVIWVVNRLK